MESIYSELALYGRKNEGAKTDKVFSQKTEVCDGMVSLIVSEKSFVITNILFY